MGTNSAMVAQVAEGLMLMAPLGAGNVLAE